MEISAASCPRPGWDGHQETAGKTDTAVALIPAGTGERRARFMEGTAASCPHPGWDGHQEAAATKNHTNPGWDG